MRRTTRPRRPHRMAPDQVQRMVARVWDHHAAGRGEAAQIVHDLIHDLTGQKSCPVCT